MGLRCSCGVRSNPIATVLEPVEFLFFGDDPPRRGTMTITVNACADTVESSTLIVNFVDQSGRTPNRSFTFTATLFEEVVCTRQGETCLLEIFGQGVVTGEITPRNFIVSFQNQQSPFLDDVLTVFIDGFGQLFNGRPVQPDLTFFGCPTI